MTTKEASHPLISRKTIFAFLLTLLLALGIHTWALWQNDLCQRQNAEHKGTPVSVDVQSGTRTMTVPCSYWIPRQPQKIQVLVLLDAAIGIVFLLSVATDWQRWRKRRTEEIASWL